MLKERVDTGMNRAISAAKESLKEGGIPIGAALVDKRNHVIGLGHNRRIQAKNPILHAEIDCLANAGRRHDYAHTVLYSTLMPCYMCAGAIIQFGIPRVVVGESRNFTGAGELLREHGVDVLDLDDPRCQRLLGAYIDRQPDVWREDIGT
jgi:cytosine/creatinine deaminase